MTRQRLRPAHSDDELDRIYAKPHDHSLWIEHRMRIAVTSLMAADLGKGFTSGADLSCGDGTVLRSLNLPVAHFGDFAPGYEYQGPIEQTIDEIPPVGVFICTESLEHLDDPDLVLRKIRGKTDRLLLSTPVDAWNETNPEHYWAWSREDVEAMLGAAGFKPRLYMSMDFRPASPDSYCFGMWGCV